MDEQTFAVQLTKWELAGLRDMLHVAGKQLQSVITLIEDAGEDVPQALIAQRRVLQATRHKIDRAGELDG